MKSIIIKLEEELRQAMVAGDVEKLDELIDDSLVFTAHAGEVVTKQMDLEGHRTKLQKTTELSPSKQFIELHENLAVVTVKMKLVGTYGEFDISGNYRYLRVWSKVGESWKIIAGSVVQIPG